MFRTKFIITLLFAVITAATAQATDYITDVKVIGGPSLQNDVNPLWYDLINNHGWTGVDYDLNKNAGGDYIYLMYKTENNTDGVNHGYITDFYIKQGSWPIPDELTHDGRTYHLVSFDGGDHFKGQKGDLNSNTGEGSDAIHIYYTTDPFPDNRAVRSVFFNSDSNGALGMNGNNASGYDLNANCKDGSAHIYMHITTGTTTPPGPSGLGLPYEYDFETSLAEAGWTLVNGATSTEIRTGGAYQGSSFFYFSGDGSTTQYLVSPEFDGLHSIAVTLYHKQGYNSPIFQLGYSTTTSDVGAFQWGPQVTGATEWTGETRNFPKGTKYMAVKCLPALASLLLDAFSFEACDYPSPEGLAVYYLTQQAAGLTWAAPVTDATVTGYAWQYKKDSDASWSAETTTTGTTVLIEGLSGFTAYSFRVKALYADGGSVYSSTGFTTSMPLPYECGFEAGMAGWSERDIATGGTTGIHPDAAHTGIHGYRFYYIYTNPHAQILISPQFGGTLPISLSFWYRNKQQSLPETFQVGYSAYMDAQEFTWEAEITASDANWHLYENSFPASTRYIAVKYNSNSEYLYLDDFSFVETSPYAKPTGLVANALSSQVATLSWTAAAGATGYSYQYKKAADGNWSTETSITAASATLTGLSANTTYAFRVKAIYEGGASNWSAFQFVTDSRVEGLPYFEDFDDANMNGWRIVNSSGESGIGTKYATGSPCVVMSGYDEPQYLVSPELAGGKALVVSFTYEGPDRDDIGSAIQFKVGYSSQTSRPEDFTWGSTGYTLTRTAQQCITSVPEGTKYIAIQKTAGIHTLYLDEIAAIDASSFPFSTTLGILCGEEKYVTTFYSHYCPFRLPEHSRAYTLSMDGSDRVFHLVGEDGSIIPRSTGVIVVSDKLPGESAPTKELVFTPLLSTTVEAHAGNILEGSDHPILVVDGKLDDASKNGYVLGKDPNGVFGFYWLNAGHESWIPGRKAYYLK